VCPLIDVLADYATVSERLAYPSQVTMAHEAGVTDRTIRNWLAILEGLGLVEVFRSSPRLKEGQWSRQTNRYLICSRKAAGMAWSMPLRRRHRVDSSPTGNEFPVTRDGSYLDGAGNDQQAPTSLVVDKDVPPVATKTLEGDWRKHSDTEIETNRSGLAAVRERLTAQ